VELTHLPHQLLLLLLLLLLLKALAASTPARPLLLWSGLPATGVVTMRGPGEHLLLPACRPAASAVPTKQLLQQVQSSCCCC
jgi:hypothetical protein